MPMADGGTYWVAMFSGKPVAGFSAQCARL